MYPNSKLVSPINEQRSGRNETLRAILRIKHDAMKKMLRRSLECDILPKTVFSSVGGFRMAWTRTVCGRLKSDYRHGPAVYNNFPWPNPTDAQKAAIEKTAQAILDARALYPDSSFAQR